MSIARDHVTERHATLLPSGRTRVYLMADANNSQQQQPTKTRNWNLSRSVDYPRSFVHSPVITVRDLRISLFGGDNQERFPGYDVETCRHQSQGAMSRILSLLFVESVGNNRHLRVCGMSLDMPSRLSRSCP